VRSDRFTLYVDEAPNHDGPHTYEAVSYLVLEAGQWELPDGTLLEVGTLDTAATVGRRVPNRWERVSFSLPFSSAPVVVSQVQTQNDAHWVKTRQRNATATGFQVALEEDERKRTPHGGETIGWLAIEAGRGNWNGHAYRAASTADAVTHRWYRINFGQTFSQASRFINQSFTITGKNSLCALTTVIVTT
jgi:serralysin